MTYGIGSKFGPVQKMPVSHNYPTPQPPGPWSEWGTVVGLVQGAEKIRRGGTLPDDWTPGADLGSPEVIQSGQRTHPYEKIAETNLGSRMTAVGSGAVAEGRGLALELADKSLPEIAAGLARSKCEDYVLVGAAALAMAYKEGRCERPGGSS